MDDFALVHVSHHQMLVLAGDDFGELHQYTVGDDLLHLVGESALTVMTGPHTGQVAVRAEILPGPPEEQVSGWDAVSEATVWCPDGRLSVGGLMGDFPDALRDLGVGGPGLVRVQVRARNRLLEDVPPPEPRPGPREEYEVLAWPVRERDVARWAARRGCEVAGLASVDWIADGLAALDRGTPLPPPFDDEGLAWDRLFADSRVPLTTVTLPSGMPNFSQQAAAFPAIFAATHDDPLVAAVDALHHTAGAYGQAFDELFAAARAAFPVLDRER